jgi:hypothetical protein
MEHRGINTDWINLAIESPQQRCLDPNDRSLERFYRSIPANGDRVLRVVVNTKVAPWLVVSVFFDRSMRGKL